MSEQPQTYGATHLCTSRVKGQGERGTPTNDLLSQHLPAVAA